MENFFLFNYIFDSFASFIFYFLIWLLFGFYGKWLAKEKGYNGNSWFWTCLLIIPFFAICGAPVKTNNLPKDVFEKEKKVNLKKTDIKINLNKKRCKKCNSITDKKNIRCSMCFGNEFEKI